MSADKSQGLVTGVVGGDLLPIQELFKEMIDKGASDLHLSAGLPPIFRLNGDLMTTLRSPLSGEQIAELVRPLVPPEKFDLFMSKKDLDFGTELEGISRFRGNLFFQNRGCSAVFRTIPNKIPSLESLNCPDIFAKLTTLPNGLILVTGPTGSGKSTTLAAMLDYLNANESVHMLTVEDPIEFVHHKKKALINQREVGPHTASFGSALKAALREDPDVILVGEMRDLETISLALTAAETGHLVFGTLHTNSAAKTVDRILDTFPAESRGQVRSMLSESLRAVISQRLLPRSDVKGRVAVHEILINNHAIGNLIREGKIHMIKNSMLSGRAEGMKLLDQSLMELFKAGTISGRTAYENAEDKVPFERFANESASSGPASPSAQPAPGMAQRPAGGAAGPGAVRPMPGGAPAPAGGQPMSALERLKQLKKTG